MLSIFINIYIKKKNVEIRFLPREKGGQGYKFYSDDNEDPKTGYLRPLMIVVVDNLTKTI